MMNGNKLLKIRKLYPIGTKVKLLNMEDEQAPPVGTIGEVTSIDDLGTIHISWQNGSTLGVVFGVDKVVKIQE